MKNHCSNCSKEECNFPKEQAFKQFPGLPQHGQRGTSDGGTLSCWDEIRGSPKEAGYYLQPVSVLQWCAECILHSMLFFRLLRFIYQAFVDLLHVCLMLWFLSKSYFLMQLFFFWIWFIFENRVSMFLQPNTPILCFIMGTALNSCQLQMFLSVWQVAIIFSSFSFQQPE